MGRDDFILYSHSKSRLGSLSYRLIEVRKPSHTTIEAGKALLQYNRVRTVRMGVPFMTFNCGPIFCLQNPNRV